MTTTINSSQIHRAARLKLEFAAAVLLSFAGLGCFVCDEQRCLGMLGAALQTEQAQAHGYKRKSIEIVHPWTSANAEAGGTEAAVGMTIRNTGRQSERLQSATSAVAERVEFRRAAADPGSPRPVSKFIEIKPGQEVHLRPSAGHVRLIGLKKALSAYDTLPLTLVFLRAGPVQVDVLVEEDLP